MQRLLGSAKKKKKKGRDDSSHSTRSRPTTPPTSVSFPTGMNNSKNTAITLVTDQDFLDQSSVHSIGIEINESFRRFVEDEVKRRLLNNNQDTNTIPLSSFENTTNASHNSETITITTTTTETNGSKTHTKTTTKTITKPSPPPPPPPSERQSNNNHDDDDDDDHDDNVGQSDAVEANQSGRVIETDGTPLRRNIVAAGTISSPVYGRVICQRCDSRGIVREINRNTVRPTNCPDCGGEGSRERRNVSHLRSSTSDSSTT